MKMNFMELQNFEIESVSDVESQEVLEAGCLSCGTTHPDAQ
jgi:hypothetical protein